MKELEYILNYYSISYDVYSHCIYVNKIIIYNEHWHILYPDRIIGPFVKYLKAPMNMYYERH